MTTNAERAAKLGITERHVYKMIARGDLPRHPGVQVSEHPARIGLTIENGIVMVGSDAHYWPGEASTAHKAFVKLIKELQPKAIIMNGDISDFGRISRFPSIGWESKPSVVEEVGVAKKRLDEIKSAGGNANRVWNLGNHDARFENRLANLVPEYAHIHGVHLKDHFPDWRPAWSTWINEDVVIKHRFKGSTHAAFNNTVYAGKTIVTGHLHSLKVSPFSDYNGIRWGVDTGTLADPYGPQFTDYTEDNPVDWRSGFVVLSFRRGVLLWPEIVHVTGDREFSFRGKVWRV